MCHEWCSVPFEQLAQPCGLQRDETSGTGHGVSRYHLPSIRSAEATTRNTDVIMPTNHLIMSFLEASSWVLQAAGANGLLAQDGWRAWRGVTGMGRVACQNSLLPDLASLAHLSALSSLSNFWSCSPGPFLG